MPEAYCMLFEIETTSRNVIEIKMFEAYDHMWKRMFYENNRKYFYHDTVACFDKYQPLIEVFDDGQRRMLYELNEIRNRVYHMNLITKEEYQFLESYHSFVLAKTELEMRRVTK